DLPARYDGDGNITGYDAFGTTTESWGNINSSGFDGLGSNWTLAIGASLAVSMTLERFKFFGGKWETILSIAVNGGLTLGYNFTNAMLLDIDGDGLADAVHNDRGAVSVVLNEGDGFASSSTPYGTLSDGITFGSTRQTNAHFGISVDLTAAGASATRQWGWVETGNALQDINADGYVDVLEKNSGSFEQNTGSGFNAMDYDLPPATGALSALGSQAEDEASKGYSRQEPVRKWKSFAQGTVEITQTVAPAVVGSISQDGVTAESYLNNAPLSTLSFGPTSTDPQSSTSVRSVVPGDNLYFRVNTATDDRGDALDWNTQVRYTTIEPFASMSARPTFVAPPAVLVADSFPGGYTDIRDLYGNKVHNSSESRYEYRRKTNWLDLMEDDDLRAAMADRGWIIPASLSEAEFRRLFDAVAPAGRSTLIDAYIYVPEMNEFVRDRNVAGLAPLISAYSKLVWSAAERSRFANHFDVPGAGRDYPERNGAGFRHTEIRSSSRNAEIRHQNHAAQLGDHVDARGLLIDQWYDPYDDQVVQKELWYLPAASGAGQLFVEEGGVRQSLSAQISGSSTVSITLEDHGVDRRYILSGYEHGLERLPSTIYETQVLPSILTSQAITFPDVRVLSTSDWAAIYAAANVTEKATLDSLYPNDENTTIYTLKPDATPAELLDVLKIIDSQTQRVDSIFNRYVDEEADDYSVLLLSGAEYTALEAYVEDATLMATGFVPLPDAASPQAYAIAFDLDAATESALTAKLLGFLRDAELFPYYEPDAAVDEWVMKTGLTPMERAEIANVLAAANVFTYTSLSRWIHYDSDDSFPVQSGTAPSTATTLRVAPGGTTRGSAVYDYIVFPAFRGQKSVYESRLIRRFDSTADFSTQDLVSYPSESNTDYYYEQYLEGTTRISATATAIPREFEIFSGGVAGWYYGVWYGYWAWNEARLYEAGTDTADEGAKLDDKEVKPPPYFKAMIKNPGASDSSSQEGIDQTGRDPAPVYSVSTDTWIGEVSTYNDISNTTSPGANAGTATEEYTFAAFIDGDQMYATRAGGDTYHRLPRASAGISGGTLGSLGNSKSLSIDGSATAWGQSFSLNRGRSW
ncbi:MAG: hypothetical protein ACLFNT_14705, partial [Spirochaetales bacterium]